jgi:hypothetical protein
LAPAAVIVGLYQAQMGWQDMRCVSPRLLLRRPGSAAFRRARAARVSLPRIAGERRRPFPLRGCRREILAAFSCKGRLGLSCCGAGTPALMTPAPPASATSAPPLPRASCSMPPKTRCTLFRYSSSPLPACGSMTPATAIGCAKPARRSIPPGSCSIRSAGSRKRSREPHDSFSSPATLNPVSGCTPSQVA